MFKISSSLSYHVSSILIKPKSGYYLNFIFSDSFVDNFKYPTHWRNTTNCIQSIWPIFIFQHIRVLYRIFNQIVGNFFSNISFSFPMKRILKLHKKLMLTSYKNLSIEFCQMYAGNDSWQEIKFQTRTFHTLV